jgi:hypothetical protein
MVESAHCGEIHTIVSFDGRGEARKCLVFNELTDYIRLGLAGTTYSGINIEIRAWALHWWRGLLWHYKI